MGMRRYLLVLDMDLLAMDEEHDLEPINYPVAGQEQESSEVIVLALVDTAQTKLPVAELLLGARAGKFPVAPQPRHDLNAAAEHRMNLAVRHLKTIGCQASGLLSEEELVKAGARRPAAVTMTRSSWRPAGKRVPGWLTLSAGTRFSGCGDSGANG